MSQDFSHRTRETALRRLKEETFDLLVVGGGITGTAVARDAASRGLKVALVERHDFATGTSSRSSKLIHGGLRYLENFEFGLVFEALAERALLLKTAPHMVRPLPFYLPVYAGDPNSRGILSLGLWLYDLLALFRAPEFHRGLSRSKFLESFPFLQKEGLKGGFRYYDASMWDDVLVVETARAAATLGATIVTYAEAVSPLWKGSGSDARISGFRVKDIEGGGAPFDVQANRVVICAGPWLDEMGVRVNPKWNRWLKPSKGVHLVFDLKRIPVPGAMVMSHPEDGRISFVIPRTDFGPGVVIVGTTDGPTPEDPAQAQIDAGDVDYLMRLLNRYFPLLQLKASDILSAYVGIRPLFGEVGSDGGAQSSEAGAASDHPPGASQALQKVSREHHIDEGPGGSIIVAGGKYTTHRKMAEEIVDFTLNSWKKDALEGKLSPLPRALRKPNTRLPVNPSATKEAIEDSRLRSQNTGQPLDELLLARYGANAEKIGAFRGSAEDFSPEGFPLLEAQLRYCIRSEMVLHLEDFVLRRIPLYLARADHGAPWFEKLASVWAEELGKSPADAQVELERLRAEVERRSSWKSKLPLPRA